MRTHTHSSNRVSFETDTQRTQRIRGSNVTTGAEIGVMWSQARNTGSQRSPEEAKKRMSPWASGGSMVPLTP